MGTLRAVWRLAKVLAVTLFRICRLFAVASVKGWSPGLMARHAREWAHALVKTLNIDITCQGRFPDRGVLMVSNHRSYLDIVVILSHFESAFLAKKELRSWPVFGYAAHLGNTVFVDRENRESRKASRQALLERLDQGISVVIFPEGTTHGGPGLLPFKKGIFHMVAEQEIPVVPVGVFYEDRSAAWIGDDFFVPHFLRIFSNPGLAADLTIGPVIQNLSGEALEQACHQFIQNSLAAKEGPVPN